MKALNTLLRMAMAVLLMAAVSSCEDVIDPSLIGTPNSTPRVVVDALLTDTSDVQEVTLTWSQPYFNNSPARPASGASLSVTEVTQAGQRTTYSFTERADKPGVYTYTGFRVQPFATYTLNFTHEGESFTASSFAPRRIEWVRSPLGYGKGERYDTLYFLFDEGTPGTDSGYRAQLEVWDSPGEDSYRLRSFQNGQLRNKPRNINPYRPTGAQDGFPFIPPVIIRLNGSGTPEDPLFKQGDTITVEIQCVDRQSDEYWNQVRIQTTNGGLFADPPANVPCNVINTREGGKRGLGWFGVATVLKVKNVIQRGKTVRLE